MWKIIGASRLALFFLWTILTLGLQGLNLLIFYRTRYFYSIPMLYYTVCCRIFNIRVHKKGESLPEHPEDNVLFLGNHLSYIDICVVGSQLKATFISKDDIRRWPVFGLLAALAKTIFIKRNAAAAKEVSAQIKEALTENRSLILFPEGSSTDGSKVLPFKSSLFELFLKENLKNNITLQPFTLQPACSDAGRIYPWYGDMEFLPHLWQLAQNKNGLDLNLIFHPPLQAETFTGRKEMARASWESVRKGLAFQPKDA